MASDTSEARRRGDDLETHASPRLSVSANVGEKSSLTERGSERLTKLLIAKSLGETIFLIALVAAFAYLHFNPRLRGTLDAADAREVSGWVVDEAAPEKRVEVELYIDGHFVARRRAGESRPDVLAAGRAQDANHGFVFETPPLPARDSEYEVSVFAAHEGADRQLIGLRIVDKPLRFKVQASEKSAGARENWWEDLER